MISTGNSAAKPWLDLAGSHCRRLNFAWWWQALTPWLTGGAALGAAAVLYLRAMREDFPLSFRALVLAGAALVLAVGAWWWARRRFATRQEGLVHLEHQLGLHNALSAAAAGVGAWPKLEGSPRAVRWKGMAVGGPLGFVLVSVALAFWLPLPALEHPVASPVPLPSSVQSAEQILQALEQAEVTKPEDLEKFTQALEALKQRGPEEWYQHASLEAADHLKESISRAASQLGQQCNASAQSLEKLSHESAEATPALKSQAADELAQALRGLQNGALQPNEKLLEKLKGLDPKQLGQQMSKKQQQQQQLQEQLKKNAAACKNCQKPGNGQGEAGSEEQTMRDAIANGEPKEGEGDQGQEGAGAPDRGPGTVDLNAKRKETNLGTNHPEKEETRDLERLAPGDLLGTSDGEHEGDKTVTGPQATGQSAATGAGGEAVVKDQGLPSEKRVLRKYFK